jgi:hypothetical protein
MNIRTLLLLCGAAFSLSACGGGGELLETPSMQTASNAVPSASQALVPGTYKLTFAAISTARLNAPISGIDIAVKLPAGLSVNTVTGGTGQISSTSVTTGNTIQASALAFGNYSASTRTAYLTMATSQESYRSGQFLNLLFSVAAGASVTPNDIYALNAAYPRYTVVGLDTNTHSSVTMTGSVKTTLGVER